MSPTRAPVLAGSWYPGDSQRLASEVDGYLAAADPGPRPAGRALVAVAPHAGYQYSGPTAGHLYGALATDRPRRVFILSPSHRAHLTQIALSGAEAFATPLGKVPVDAAATTDLDDHPLFAVDDAAHAQEHAIEIQLPFLQRLWPDAVPTIIPLLVPPLDDEAGRAAAQALVSQLDEDSLLLVSTDFTHYGQAYGYVPFVQDVPASLERLDSGAVLRILAGDGSGLRAYGRQSGITMCGLAATAVALDCGLPSGYEGALLHYARSGDRDGNYDLSVSYAAVLLTDGSIPNQ